MGSSLSVRGPIEFHSFNEDERLFGLCCLVYFSNGTMKVEVQPQMTIFGIRFINNPYVVGSDRFKSLPRGQ